METITILEILRDEFQSNIDYLQKSVAKDEGQIKAYTAVVERLDQQIDAQRAVMESLERGESHGISERALELSRAMQEREERRIEAAVQESARYDAEHGAAVTCGDFPAPCNCDDPITHGGH